MNPILLAALSSFGICLVFTPIIRRLATRWNLVDRPDAVRKLHARPIPVAGGIILLVALLSSVSLLLIIPNPLRDELRVRPAEMLSLLAGGAVICLVGVADDIW